MYCLTACKIKEETVVFGEKFIEKMALLEFSHPNILFHICSYFYNMNHCFNYWTGFTKVLPVSNQFGFLIKYA